MDYSRYPKNWLSEIRPRILARANNCCEECGFENYQVVLSFKSEGKTTWVNSCFRDLIEVPFKEVRVVLTIAHLDHDATNHDVSDDRLKAMCQLCHLNYDRVNIKPVSEWREFIKKELVFSKGMKIKLNNDVRNGKFKNKEMTLKIFSIEDGEKYFEFEESNEDFFPFEAIDMEYLRFHHDEKVRQNQK